MDAFTIFKGTVGIILLVVLPGYALTLALFPRKDSIDSLERIALSFVLGLTPQLILYFMDKNFGAVINTMTSLLATLFVVVLGVLVWQVRLGKLENTG